MEALQVAGTHWTIESSFETAEGAVGWDYYEVRRWTGSHRYSTLAMWAYLLLAALRAGHLREVSVQSWPVDAAQSGRVQSSMEPWVPLLCN